MIYHHLKKKISIKYVIIMYLYRLFELINQQTSYLN